MQSEPYFLLGCYPLWCFLIVFNRLPGGNRGEEKHIKSRVKLDVPHSLLTINAERQMVMPAEAIFFDYQSAPAARGEIKSAKPGLSSAKDEILPVGLNFPPPGHFWNINMAGSDLHS